MIVATAGHVDHGKTTLIKSLTGVDTDRLPEEKKRGLSIDLGFAYVADDSDSATSIGFIDVPGHERFVRNMIAGVGSIDMALLVVAADDGPMPQTSEHLAILQLLGVDKIIGVITKTDLVDNKTAENATRDLSALLDQSAIAQSEIVVIAAGDDVAVDKLRIELFKRAKELQVRALTGQFRLAIDRSFSVTGAGSVVTGTVMSGDVSVDDSVLLLSTGTQLRVRGIHAQNKTADRAIVGQRCALNISGGDLKNVVLKRGDWLCANRQLQPVRTIDACITPSPSFDSDDTRFQSSGIKHWTSAHLHLATVSVPCRIALLEAEQLAAGEYGLVRLICDQPLGAVSGDRFVIRDQSAQYTIGGGFVLDPAPPKRGRSRAPRLEVLRAMQRAWESQNSVVKESRTRDSDADSAEEIYHKNALVSMLNFSKNGVDLQLFVRQFNCLEDEVNDACRNIDAIVCEHSPERWAIAPKHWAVLQQQLLQSLDQWHDDNPNLLGPVAEQLRRSLRQRVPVSVFMHAINSLVAAKKIVKKAAVYKNPIREASLDAQHEALWEEIKHQLDAAGLIAPRVVQIAEVQQKSSEEIVQLLNTFVAHGRLYRVSGNRYYLPAVLHKLAYTGQLLADKDNFTVRAYRDETGIGRNLVIELLEFFDRIRFTRRLGQKRMVIEKADSLFDS